MRVTKQVNMDFLTKVNLIKDVETYREVVTFFKSLNRDYHGCRMYVNGNEFLFVQDDWPVTCHVCYVAVVNQTEGKMVDWVIFRDTDNLDGLEKWIKDGVEDNKWKATVRVPVRPEDCLFLKYICNCCGGVFNSSMAEQDKYQLEEEIGICPGCEKYLGQSTIF